MIEVGQPFPRFALANQEGRTLRLEDFAGRWLVVYVYPKDDTPGCTIQGQSFTASKADFDALGAIVLGLSEDDVASHQAFCTKFGFTIDLLADPKHELLKALGVGQMVWNGTPFWIRSTVVVDPSGVVRKVYTKVKPDGHDRALLEDLKALQAGAP